MFTDVVASRNESTESSFKFQSQHVSFSWDPVVFSMGSMRRLSPRRRALAMGRRPDLQKKCASWQSAMSSKKFGALAEDATFAWANDIGGLVGRKRGAWLTARSAAIIWWSYVKLPKSSFCTRSSVTRASSVWISKIGTKGWNHAIFKCMKMNLGWNHEHVPKFAACAACLSWDWNQNPQNQNEGPMYVPYMYLMPPHAFHLGFTHAHA